MFNKEIFSEILKKIYNTYNNQRDFADSTEVNRAYLSRYMNQRLENPPTPKILAKIAKASNGITTYEELMAICGHITKNDFDSFLLSMFGFSNEDLNQFNEALDTLNMTDLEKSLFYTLVSEYQNSILNGKKPPKAKDVLGNCNQITLSKLSSALKLYEIFIEKIADFSNIIATYKKTSKNTSSVFMIPILGKITAGQPILAEEYLEGYLPIDPNIYGMTTPDDYFYLKVSGDSMNQKVLDGDYVLIHKQNYAENDDIVVAIVNGDNEATLKRYKVINEQFIQLEPMSSNPIHETKTIDLKTTNFVVIGKAIGKFGKF